ncbi:hypothetical protein Tco_1503546 [Tanacetum coccineum]
MSSMQEDIQCAGSDTRPPMLDRTDFESWQQRIRLYCLGKDNGENIMKSIKGRVPFQMGSVSDVIMEEPRVRSTGYLIKGIIYHLINHYTDAKRHLENVKMILEGSELTKDDRESQLYDEFEHFFFFPHWSRFITSQINRGLKESNCDQLYAYLLKQLEVHANENKEFDGKVRSQPNNDHFALVSDASDKRILNTISKSPQSSRTYLSDNFPTGLMEFSTETDEVYPTRLALSLNHGKVVVQDVRGRYNATNQGRPFQRNNARGNGVAGNVGAQNRGGMINPGQAKPIKLLQGKMLLMQAQESGAVLDEEQSLFLAGEQVTNVDDDVDDSQENDLALNVDHIFEADECDAFDSDVDEGPTSQTMFMANLTSEDPIYDEGLGHHSDSNNPS